MVILLPKQNNGLPLLESELSADKLSSWLKDMTRKEVELHLPRFKMTAEFSLKDVLVSLGMVDAFSGAADFSGMDGSKELAVAEVLHKAFVEVKEEGTEAAAATAVVTVGGSAFNSGQTVFRADHPFLFLICHKKTGSLLFLGRVMNPSA